ncbi:hypothetical protein SAMN02745866_02460 [Alteromonadaceae bacterium Bs31]|nr:hypothetical protein SAMN02745866_02460 [Alteromonadaceae bacterium Bs31]
MKRLKWTLLVIQLALGGWLVPAQACEVRDGDTVPSLVMPLKYENRRANVSYHFELLGLALKKSEQEFGPCEPRITELYLPSNRLNLHSVEKNLVDVVDTTTSRERDERLLPIRIPLLKGLMGYRVMFINKGDQGRFNEVKTIEQFRTFSMGQGADWPDVEILTRNGFKVVTAVTHQSLTKMLIAKRFDAYPRGVQQILVERSNRSDSALQVEKNIALAYVSPVYFHVAKDNQALAERIEKGLKIAIEDGSFDKHFNEHKLIKRAIKKLDLEKRNIFYLCNPYIHPDTPIDEDKYWWRPWPKDQLCK